MPSLSPLSSLGVVPLPVCLYGARRRFCECSRPVSLSFALFSKARLCHFTFTVLPPVKKRTWFICCDGRANLGRYTNIQIHEKCINILAHTMYLNREVGGGGDYFCDPVIQHFWCLWIVMCWKTVVYCDWSGLPETRTATILHCESWIPIYIEEIKSLLINSVFLFCFFFQRAKASANRGSSSTYILWRDKIKNKTKKSEPVNMNISSI